MLFLREKIMVELEKENQYLEGKKDKTSRRKFLTTLGATTATILAGCSTDEETPSETPSENQTDTEEPQTTDEQNETQKSNGDDEEDDEEEQDPEDETRSLIDMPSAFRIDYRNTGNIESPIFNYQATDENGEPYSLDDPAVEELDLEELDQLF